MSHDQLCNVRAHLFAPFSYVKSCGSAHFPEPDPDLFISLIQLLERGGDSFAEAGLAI